MIKITKNKTSNSSICITIIPNEYVVANGSNHFYKNAKSCVKVVNTLYKESFKKSCVNSLNLLFCIFLFVKPKKYNNPNLPIEIQFEYKLSITKYLNIHSDCGFYIR